MGFKLFHNFFYNNSFDIMKFSFCKKNRSAILYPKITAEDYTETYFANINLNYCRNKISPFMHGHIN